MNNEVSKLTPEARSLSLKRNKEASYWLEKIALKDFLN